MRNKLRVCWISAIVMTLALGEAVCASTSKALEIAVITDWETVEYFRSVDGAHLYFDTTIEEAAQLFREQLGIDLVLVEATIPASPEEDMIGAHTLVHPLLEDVLVHRLKHGQHRRSDVTVLFTRRLLIDDKGGFAGYATNKVCSAASGAIVRVENAGFDYQVLAHELAHTIGAGHDAEGPCEAESATGWLMGATFHPSTSFSQCSIQQIQVALADQGACLTDFADTKASVANVGSERNRDPLWVGLICSGSLLVLLAPVSFAREHFPRSA